MPLRLPAFRRVLGVFINTLMMIIGFAEFAFPHVFAGAAPSGLSVDAPGSLSLLILAGALSPFILLPCLTDRYPRWVEQLPPDILRMAKKLIGAK